jgi:hypothetical protein
MKRYVEDIGYVEVKIVDLCEVPYEAIYFVSDEEMSYYISGREDTIWGVRI